MTTITLPSEIEAPVVEAARRQGKTAEEVLLATLRREFAPARPSGDFTGKSLYDVLADHIGVVSGTGEAFSQNCGERFAEGMVEKRERGRL